MQYPTVLGAGRALEQIKHDDHPNDRRRRFCVALGCLGFGATPAFGANPTPSPMADKNAKWLEVQEIVAAASRPGLEWRGPTTGPKAASGKTIALWADNLRNGGVLGVAVGVREAARQIGWPVRLFHSDGTRAGMQASLANAIAAGSSGIIVLAGDHRQMDPLLRDAAGNGTKIVGWHVAASPGPVPASPISVNISTDQLEVASVTALAALLPTRGDAGIVIFTDNSIEIARAKSEQMIAVIRGAGGTLLEVVDIPLAAVPQKVPDATSALLLRHGARWTHALAINDIYFDYAVAQMTSQGRSGHALTPLTLLSAGDGSASAILRIMASSFQSCTVAEPLNLHGWQLIDEMNRLFNGFGPTNFVAPTHLLTRANIAYDGGPRMMFDPDNGYRDNYRHIWSAA
ncbi:MAG: sugar transporter substrate-binding protein [Herbaspirillum sp.]|nr:sugar transporter substrate-binding protein [Herbaspirillum sp.]